MNNYPKIGIRPTIDGRQGGVRESLEEKTMALAKAVAELITSNLHNGDGSPVECVIADTTIGRVAESAACAEKFEREGVGSTITVTSCWCYGSETMDMNPYYPKAVWGFNGTERPGAVYLAAVLAAHAQKGLPAFGIYGHDVQDLDDNTIPADVAEKILRFAKAAQAVATMKGKSYLSMGNTRRFDCECRLPAAVLRYAHRVCVAGGDTAPCGFRHLRQGRVCKGHGMGREILQATGGPRL